MEKWVLVVRSKCIDRLREDEFNNWYNKFHLPDILATPGFVSARRFMNPDFSAFGGGKYLAIYDIETDDINQTIAAIRANVVKTIKDGRYTDLINETYVALYRQITSLTK